MPYENEIWQLRHPMISDHCRLVKLSALIVHPAPKICSNRPSNPASALDKICTFSVQFFHKNYKENPE
jgi:hypothetical protein